MCVCHLWCTDPESEQQAQLLAAIRRQATRLLVTEQIDFSYVDAQECLMQRHVAQAFYEIELLFGVSDAAFATRVRLSPSLSS